MSDIQPVSQPDGNLAFEHGGAPVDRIAFLNQLFDDFESAHMALEQELNRAFKANGLLPQDASFELNLGDRTIVKLGRFGASSAVYSPGYRVHASGLLGTSTAQLCRHELVSFAEFKPGEET